LETGFALMAFFFLAWSVFLLLCVRGIWTCHFFKAMKKERLVPFFDEDERMND
jgi:hypothetical protein